MQMIANVTEQLWIDFGLDSAVFLDYIAFWLKGNAANKQQRNFHEGRYWTYNTLDALHTIFPGWSKDTIRGIIRKCVKNGLLIISNFNKKKYDRTSWYTLTDKAIEYYPKLSEIMQRLADNPGGVSLGEIPTASGEIPTPIPKLLPTSSNNTITTISESDDSGATATKTSKQKNTLELMWQMIAAYRQIFPDNPQPHDRVISTSLQRTLQALIKRWHELDPQGKPFSLDMFTRYLSMLREGAPKFSLSEYTTKQGNKKKNNMLTFCRWDTVVKFLENQYS